MKKVWDLINRGELKAADDLLDKYNQTGTHEHTDKVIARASILINQGNHKAALDELSSLGEQLDLIPRAIGLKALCLSKANAKEDALKLFQQAVSRSPDLAELQHNMSVLLGDLGRWDESCLAAQKACELAPNHMVINLNLGRTLVNLKKGNDALKVFKKCIKLDKNSGDAWAGLGAAYLVLNDYQKGIEAISKAIRFNPDSGPVNANMGIANKNIGEFDLAEKYLRRSVELEPDYPEHHWNLSLIMLLKGDYENGWAEYEWRYHPARTSFDRVKIPELSIPMLKRGDSLAGKTVAIVAEQGLGDCIQFSRFAKFIKEAGGNVVLFLPEMLAKVFQTMPWVDAICTTWKNTPKLDAWCFVMSLPHLFGGDHDLFEIKTPYLYPLKYYEDKWSKRISSNKVRVGLVWAGRPTHGNDAIRSMKLSDFSEILKDQAVQFYSLQMGEASHQISEFKDKVIDLGADIQDFCDTAGILANLDLLISIDSAPVHIAGALGVPVWVLVSKVPDFRWGLESERTPWYESCTVYRQDKHREWKGVCKRISDDLAVFKRQERKLLALPEIPADLSKPIPGGFVNYNKHAIALQNSGREQEAQDIYHWALKVEPNHVDVLRNLAVSYRRVGKSALAKEYYERAILANPKDALTYANYCNLLIDLRELDFAVEIADKAIAINDTLAPPYYAKSAHALEHSNKAEALVFAKKAAELDPTKPAFLAMIAQILLRDDKHHEAKEYIDRGLRLNPNHAETLIGLGQYYANEDLQERAVEVYQQAEAHRKDLPELYSNMAVALSRLNRYDEAIHAAQRAIELQPNYADAHFNLSLYLLTKGNYKEGFAEYEWRYRDERLARDRTVLPTLSRPRWAGEPLEGKTILIYTEQGNGDCIQFLAYVKVLKEMGARVYVAVKEPLQKLFKSCPWVDKVCVHGEQLSDYDYWTLFLSIPYCLGDDKLRAFPGKYLYADPSSSDFDIEPYLDKGKVNIGIVWSGSPTHGGDKWRSINPGFFDFLTNSDQINLIGINRAGEEARTVTIGENSIPNIGNQLNDFNELACVIEKLDLLISVDSAPAHLAGALNKIVYVLLPYAPDWRWGLDSKTTPSYERMSLIRQTTRNNWTSLKAEVMEKINEDFGLNEKMEPKTLAHSKKKIAVVIPTYNRLDKLKVAVESVFGQVYDLSKVELHLVVHNSCSTDGTDDFIKNLSHSSVVVHGVNNVTYDENGKIIYVDKANWSGAVNSVPEDVQWTWLMGDDDFIDDHNAIQIFSELVDKYPDVEFMHFCQSRRSKKSEKIISGSLFELCNRMGYHEVLGWMSSILFKSNIFKLAINSSYWTDSLSAYPHSACILGAAAYSPALFIDKPLVEPQDKEQTKESIERWMNDNMGEKYFYVIDDLKHLIEKNQIPGTLSPVFFRYLTYSLWDRYAAYLLGEVLNKGVISEKAQEHWARVQSIYNMLDDKVFKKQYALWVNNIYNRVIDYAELHAKLGTVRAKLITEHKNQNVGTYEFSNLDSNLKI